MHTSPCSSRGPLIENLILILFGLSIAAVLVVSIGRFLAQRARAREEREQGLETSTPERSPQEREQDRKTAVIWGAAAILVPAVLVLAYLVTR